MVKVLSSDEIVSVCDYYLYRLPYIMICLKFDAFKSIHVL
jgi:hypothetical protein